MNQLKTFQRLQDFLLETVVSLRIGSELIEFSGVTKTPPYKFTGCKRGANGTKPSSHPVNEKVFHLSEMFGRFVPGPETALFNEIARNTAEIVSDCGFDGIYFDAIDGSDILGGEENFWYYGTKFIFEVAKQSEASCWNGDELNVTPLVALPFTLAGMGQTGKRV